MNYKITRVEPVEVISAPNHRELANTLWKSAFISPSTLAGYMEQVAKILKNHYLIQIDTSTPERFIETLIEKGFIEPL